MEKSATISRYEAEPGRFASLAANDPVLLALPPRRAERQAPAAEARGDSGLDRLQVIETGCGPKVETSLLADLLARNLGLEQVLADPVEVQIYHNPLASVNAYKHRFHALRCEYVNARLRIEELEAQLDQARGRVRILENHAQFLEDTLTQMRASRGWKLLDKCSRWRRNVLRWLLGG